MDNYRKISIVNEYNVKTGEWDIKTIVIFKNDSAPVVEDFDDDKHLKLILDFIKDSNLGLENASFRDACNAGIISVVSKSNEKDMATLNSEILKEQIKYEITPEKNLEQEIKDTVDEQESSLNSELSKEYKELLSYFKYSTDKARKERLAAEGNLPPVGFDALNNDIAEMKKIASTNEMAASLEEAAEKFKNGEISEVEYDRIYSVYRDKLADAIKNLSKDDVVKEEEINKPKLSEEDQGLLDYFRYLADKTRKERLAAEGKLPPVGFEALNNDIEEMKKIAATNERAAALEEAAKRLSEGRLSQAEYDRIYNTYRAQLADAIKNLSKEDTVKEEETNESKFSKEDRELLDYFKCLTDKKRKERLASEGMLPPIGFEALNNDNEEIKKLVKVNERVAKLEEAAEKFNNGEISEDEYDNIYRMYRKQLVDAINNNSRKSESSKATTSDFRREETRTFSPDYLTSEEDAATIASPEENSRPVDVDTVSPETISNSGVIPEEVVPEEENDTTTTVSETEDSKPEVVPDEEKEPSVTVSSEEDSKPVDVDILSPEISSIPGIIPPKILSEEEKETDSPESTSEEPESDEEKSESITPSIKLVEEPKSPEVVGGIDDTPDEEETVDTGKEKVTTRIKKAWKKLVAGVLALGTAIGAGFGLSEWLKNRKNNQPIFGTQHNKVIDNRSKLDSTVSAYMDKMNAPLETRNFIFQNNVMEFLSQYKNEAQINEVVSALCYGYEQNMLNKIDGNFKLDKDGFNYLSSFTNDFLCAKVVVNNYTPEQMLAVFGDTNISYEQVMDGFKAYCTTLSVYGTTATKTPAFRYLTNGDNNTSRALTDLFNKLVIVNQNRSLGILNSTHTDNFITAVDNFFVHNDQKLQLSEGAKTVAASIVDAYTTMQANVGYGEALYLHEDRGLSKAGINLVSPLETELNGTVISESKDSLLNNIHYLYVNQDKGNNDCLNARQILQDNLKELYSLSNSTVNQKATAFANLLYQNGLGKYANEISKGNYSQELLNKIELENPALALDVDYFEQAIRVSSNSSYVPFKTTVDGVDALIGVKGLVNNIAPLINSRMDIARSYDNYKVVSGKNYITVDKIVGNGASYLKGSLGGNGIPQIITPSTTKQKVSYDELTDEEKRKVDSQIEQEQNGQKANAEKEAQEIINKIQSGEITSQEQAQEAADKIGMTLEPGLVEQIKNLHDNPTIAEQQDAKYAQMNEEEVKKSIENAENESNRQQEEVDEINSLIAQGGNVVEEQPGNSDVLSPDIDYSDSNIDQGVDERPYQSDSEQTKEELNAMKAFLTEIDAKGLVDEVNVNEQQNGLTL